MDRIDEEVCVEFQTVENDDGTYDLVLSFKSLSSKFMLDSTYGAMKRLLTEKFGPTVN